MRYILIIFMMMVIPSVAQANGKIYNDCKVKFGSKMSPQQVEIGCSCVQEQVQHHIGPNPTESQMLRTVSNCFTRPMQTELQTTFYSACMNNPNRPAGSIYQEYCACTSKWYAFEMMKYGMHAILDDNRQNRLHAHAAEKAKLQCRPY